MDRPGASGRGTFADMDPISELVLATIGGGLGATFRWGAGVVAERWGVPNWIAIMGINTVGCLAMGIAIGIGGGAGMQAFVMAGVLGGFTTFSTAMLDVWLLWRLGQRLRAAICLLGTPALATIAFTGGILMGAVVGGQA